MKLCDTCIYRNNVEQLKPCIIYRDDCEYYEKERDMTREEAITELKILREDYWDDDNYGHETKQYDVMILALDEAIKALEQEPKTGHWITEHPLDYFQPDEYKCSECGCYYHKKVNECPNCGAKMFEPQESEVQE